MSGTRNFDIKMNEGILNIRIDNDSLLSFKIDPVGISENYHLHHTNPDEPLKPSAEIIIETLDNFYNFTEQERDEYLKVLLNILDESCE